MDAVYKSLTGVLEPNIRFRVPIYQRTYDWHREHCKQLFDDIVQIGQSDGNRVHFLGTLTFVDESSPVGAVPTYQIIDGQQRLTTFMLLLTALKTLSDEKSDVVTKGKIDQLLFNANEKDNDEYFKLILTDDDNNFFRNVLNHVESEKPSNIVSNFKYFKTLLTSSNIPIETVWYGIKRLAVVTVTISDRGDPQAIFESMNSTGLNLSDTDMIQNYFLMSFGSKRQKELYNTYWKPMERRFGDDGDEYFDEFLRNYLMMMRRSVVPKNQVYAYFKKHMLKLDRQEEIKKISGYSKYYANLVGVCPYESEKINAAINNIRMQETKIAHAFLLKILIDHADQKVCEEDVLYIFQLVESYLLRCYVCETAKGGNKMFPELIAKIDEKDYRKSIENAIMSKGGNRRFPRDVIFKEKLQQCQLYNNGTICNYMLVRIEQKGDKEPVKTDNLQIEHIMPQQLTDDWKKYLGSSHEYIHEKYLHTIGNLTLTGYNSELGNSLFAKKQILYKKSNLRITQELAEYKEWDEEAIKKRTKLLTNESAEIWKCPIAPDVTDDSDDSEEDYLEGKEVVELWHTLKARIENVCNGVTFYMRQRFGTYRLDRDNTSTVICSMQARKNKIKLTYNVKTHDNVISQSEFVNDVSNVSSDVVGDFRSIIYSEDDIDEAINTLIKAWEYKIRQSSRA